MGFTPRKTLRNARTLRREETEAERLLWSHIRNRRLKGHKFVRQEPIGPFIADFLCRERMLIVEVDGATHSDARDVEYDARRTAYLEGHGYRVLRVQNAEVFKALSDVLETIRVKLERDGGAR